MGRYINEEQGEAEVGCLGRLQEVRCGPRVRVVEVLEYVDGYGGIQDRAEVHMRGIRNLGQPGMYRKGS